MEEVGDKFVFNKKVPTTTRSSILIAIGFFVFGAAVIVVLINEFNVDFQQGLVIMLAGVLVYAISVYLAIKVKHVRKEFDISKPEKVHVTSEPEVRLVPQVIKEEIIVPKIIRQEVKVPVYIKKKVERKPAKRYKYVASVKAKIYHPASSRLARLIRPKNRVYSDSIKELHKKGYKPSKKVLIKHKKKIKKSK